MPVARGRALAAADRSGGGPARPRLRRGPAPGRGHFRRGRGAGVGLRPRGHRRPGCPGGGGARHGPTGAGGVGPPPAWRRSSARGHGRDSEPGRGARSRGRDPVPGAGVSAALRLAERLLDRWDARAVAVTLGGSGAVVRHRHGACSAAPAPTVEERDACGAGDHFAGGVAAALAGGATVDEAVAQAVAAAADFVARGGGGTVRRGSGRGANRPRRPARPRPRWSGWKPCATWSARVRGQGGTVVAAGGSFDRLHTGHTATLAAARALGDCLLVLVNSDESVRRRTGTDGPAVPLTQRLDALAALDEVAGVAVFDADDPCAVLDALRPDLWVKGGDHDPADLPETRLVRSWGGEVIAVPYRADANARSPPGRPHPATRLTWCSCPGRCRGRGVQHVGHSDAASSAGSGSAAKGSPRRAAASPSARCGPRAGGPHWAGPTGPNSVTDGVPNAYARWAIPVSPLTTSAAPATSRQSSARPVAPASTRSSPSPAALATPAASSRSAGEPVTSTGRPSRSKASASSPKRGRGPALRPERRAGVDEHGRAARHRPGPVAPAGGRPDRPGCRTVQQARTSARARGGAPPRSGPTPGRSSPAGSPEADPPARAGGVEGPMALRAGAVEVDHDVGCRAGPVQRGGSSVGSRSSTQPMRSTTGRERPGRREHDPVPG